MHFFLPVVYLLSNKFAFSHIGALVGEMLNSRNFFLLSQYNRFFFSSYNFFLSTYLDLNFKLPCQTAHLFCIFCWILCSFSIQTWIDAVNNSLVRDFTQYKFRFPAISNGTSVVILGVSLSTVTQPRSSSSYSCASMDISLLRLLQQGMGKDGSRLI